MNLNSRRIALVIFLGLVFASFIVFFIHNTIALDPDFGWHLKLGELTLKHGFQYKDTFSYTMLSFPAIDHEWLADVVIYFLYKIHPLLLSFFFAAFPIGAIAFSLKKQFKVYYASFFLLAASILLSFSGLRIQVISWFLAAVLLTVLLNEKLWKKWKITIPVLILIWANLHGSFAVAIYLLSIFIVLRIIQKRVDRYDFLVLGGSILATFINPYGARLWGEVLSSITDSALRWEIIEWLPGVFFFDLSFFILLALSFVLIFRYRKKLKLQALVIYLALLLLVISSVRHLPYFIVATLIIVPPFFEFFREEVKKNEAMLARFSKAVLIFVLYALAVFLSKTYSIGLHSDLSEKKYYPKSAVSFLKKQNINGEIFSVYNWGGYLLWKLPEKRVFIDGRMPSWQWRASASESDSAFKDYASIVSGAASYEKFFKKYNVHYVLWQNKNSKPLSIDVFGVDISLLQNSNHYKARFISRLEYDHWAKIFEDKTAVIYKK